MTSKLTTIRQFSLRVHSVSRLNCSRVVVLKMYLLHLLLTAYFILGGLFTGSNAGLLDSLGGVIGIGVNTNRPRYPATNTNNFRPTNNRDFQPNNNNDVPYYDEIINSNDEDPNANQGNTNIQTTTKRSVPNRGDLELTEKELIAAEKFPELQNLLAKLKELNRQKELEKQKNLNRPNSTNGSTVTQSPINKEVKDKNGWVQLKKRKIFFKAQPVRPENEILPKDKEEIIYYLE